MKDRNVEFPNRFRMTKVEGTDDIYDLIPAPGEVIALGDTFSKANMLPDSIPAALGLKMGNPQVKDALNVLANIGNVHVWGKRLYELTGVIADATDATATVYLNNGYYLYAKAEIVNGEIVCSEKLERYSSPTNYVGYYAYNGVNVYRVTSNSYSSSTGYSFTGILQEVKSQSILGSIVSYVVSTDPNAYPQDGDLDGVHYTYVGVLGDRTRIEVGSYVGTGTYGKDNPNTLTFGFVPKIIWIAPISYTDISATIRRDTDKGIAIYVATNIYTLTTSWSGNAVTWYSNQALYQLNASGVAYSYIALG